MPRPPRLANLAAMGMLLGLLAGAADGCGGGGRGNGEAAEAPGRVWADARAATAGAAEVHVQGTVTRSGQALGLDLDMSSSGRGGGTIKVQGSRLELVVTAREVYVNAGEAAWSLVGDGRGMASYAGRWVEAPRTGSALAGVAAFASTPDFVRSLVPAGRLTKEPSLVRWHGQQAIVLLDSHRARIYVAASGPPHLLHLAGGTSAAQGVLSFSGYGRARPPTAPATALALPLGSRRPA